MKKTSVLVFLVACSALFVACTHRVATDTDTPSTGTGAVQDGTGAALDDGTVTMENDVEIVRVQMSGETIDPEEIRVKQGAKVKLIVENTGLTQHFAIEGLGIDAEVVQGKPMVIDLDTEKAGTFEFACTAPCGPGNAGMVGKLVIEE